MTPPFADRLADLRRLMPRMRMVSLGGVDEWAVVTDRVLLVAVAGLGYGEIPPLAERYRERIARWGWLGPVWEIAPVDVDRADLVAWASTPPCPDCAGGASRPSRTDEEGECCACGGRARVGTLGAAAGEVAGVVVDRVWLELGLSALRSRRLSLTHAGPRALAVFGAGERLFLARLNATPPRTRFDSAGADGSRG